MPPRNGQCPRCRREYPWGTTTCPVCHVGLELFAPSRTVMPDTPVFETGDRPSADIVAGLLGTQGIPCTIRGTDGILHAVLGRSGSWWVLVPAADAARAQEILDAEIGREEPT